MRSYHLRSLRKHIALVSQEPTLFAGTIRENIVYETSKKTSSEIEIIEVAKVANAHDFIVALKDGYSTWCGDGGIQLSVGPKATNCYSSGYNEETLCLALRRDQVMVGKTSVVAAHKLSTIQSYHLIVVLDKGKVVEKGTHSPLLARGSNGAYYSLRCASHGILT
ncbi:hypothetical protein FNV43_RR15461 [Rhamnella rubrinervis]|uniref:Uncharacterized protein n=1 Tax=Rhamnella rubrinervis TaxID=2594499 RepID=A0A8K0ECT7_9ROSA|nr:hypothetical protein FNV43_RR15461 [Rhamnella rubrinervis]